MPNDQVLCKNTTFVQTRMSLSKPRRVKQARHLTMYHTTLGEEVASSQKSDIIAIIKRRTYRIELCCSLVGIAWTAAVDAVAVAADAVPIPISSPDITLVVSADQVLSLEVVGLRTTCIFK